MGLFISLYILAVCIASIFDMPDIELGKWRINFNLDSTRLWVGAHWDEASRTWMINPLPGMTTAVYIGGEV